jgi:hypothetical protein
MLQYSQFDECIDFLTTPIEQFYKTGPNRTALLGSVEVIIENYIKFFTEELESAILSKGNPDQKNDLIRFYVSRLMKSINHRSFKFLQSDSQAIIPNANENTPASFWINGNLVLNPSEDPNNDLRYKRGCNILYHLLFDELQKCCSIYDIPFHDICLKLGFPVYTINIQARSPNKLNLPKQAIIVPKGAIEKLKLALQENGFQNLPKVSELNEQSRDELIRLICSNDVPYKIAMFDFLGFTDYFLSEFAATKTEMYKRFSEIICAGNRPVSARTIQGNMNDLRKNAINRDPRYTASQHRDEVKKHYETLR